MSRLHGFRFGLLIVFVELGSGLLLLVVLHVFVCQSTLCFVAFFTLLVSIKSSVEKVDRQDNE